MDMKEGGRTNEDLCICSDKVLIQTHLQLIIDQGMVSRTN